MYLVYFDDSGSDHGSPLAVVGALVVEDKYYGFIHGSHGACVENLIPPDRLDGFQEFHGFELFRGDGIFKGIDDDARFAVIRAMLSNLGSYELPFFYAAVDKDKVAGVPLLGSAHPVDVGFQQCLLAIDKWASQQQSHPPDRLNPYTDNLCVYIWDETKDIVLRKQLRTTYRRLRTRIHRVSDIGRLQLFCAHDDIYFSHSHDSIGVQMADLCSYFTLRRLRGLDAEGFFDGFATQAHCARSPDHGDLFRCVGDD